ncbi:antitoxin Xre/MbcA/ParS toxin-binding domain-containing protein [Halopseudomonas sp.]|uniref:antitoxin Xre/MbcA/ParS toxin-binding domain-containing protein n=1 Tax=Halopseudomonas sp. TaxID=2901191 RepID=UPI003565488F
MPGSKDHLGDHPVSLGADAHGFWIIAKKLFLMTERERIRGIRSGFDVTWLFAAKTAFNLDDSAISSFAGMSVKTLRRRLKKAILLGSPASERFDRLAQLAVLSEIVFEARSAARGWMITPNDSLGGEAPLFLCRTELGGRQASRVLRAIEWGGVV